MNGDDSTYVRRREDRRDVSFVAEIVLADSTLGCRIQNISVGGARVEVDQAVNSDKEVVLKIDSFGQFPAEIAWSRGLNLGLKFKVDPDRMAEIVMAMALY